MYNKNVFLRNWNIKRHFISQMEPFQTANNMKNKNYKCNNQKSKQTKWCDDYDYAMMTIMLMKKNGMVNKLWNDDEEKWFLSFQNSDEVKIFIFQ